MIFVVESLIYIVYKIIFATPSIQKNFGSDHSPARGSHPKIHPCRGGKVLGVANVKLLSFHDLTSIFVEISLT